VGDTDPRVEPEDDDELRAVATMAAAWMLNPFNTPSVSRSDLPALLAGW